MNNSIQSISEQLIGAVDLIMNAFTPEFQRNEAHKIIEEFRDTSPYCAECGIFLSSSSHPSNIRHFGLSLIDHYIKLHWNTIACDEKLRIKNNVLEILSKDISSTEISLVKNALARIVVEIIKREWPQQWPSLLDELHAICVMGDIQTELVLLIFLRIAEDIVQLQNIPDKRRKEVYRTLCACLDDLFSFFLNTLINQCEKYFSYKSMPVEMNVAMQNHCRVAHVTLETLCVYIEWVPIERIVHDPSLFKQLCHLLNDEYLQIDATKCLLSLVERKGKPEDRKPILKLFEENELFKIRSQSVQTLEQYHLFLKLLSQTLVTLGTSLSYLMSMFKDVAEPENFSLYLNCVLSLTSHPSLVISQSTQILWSTFLRDLKLSQILNLQGIIPNLLKCETEKLFKIGYPSMQSSKASKYSIIEFDCDEDFETTYCRLRADVCEILKLITKHEPELAFSYGSLMLKYLLNNQASSIVSQIEDSNCLNIKSIWDAVAHYYDAVCTSLMKNMNSPNVQNLSKSGIELLYMTLNFNSEDLYIQSYALSCISALFFFTNFCIDAVMPVFRKIFSNLASTSISEENSLLSKEELNLRRHSCSLLIKLCSSQSKLLLPIFDHLCQNVKDLLYNSDHLSALEKSAMLESLMILSNELCDYDKQLIFLNEMLSPVIGKWLTDSIKLVVSSPEHFIEFTGLHKSPDEASDIFQKNKAELLLICNVLKTCAKRCKIVTDPVIAQKGNFIHPLSQNLNTVLYKNPGAQLITPVLPGVFHLIRTIHSLHEPEFQAKMHPRFAGVLDISESDRNSILGISHQDNNQLPKSAFERMKTFIQSIEDSCLHTLGDAAENLMIDFYTIPKLSIFLNECLFHCLPYIPDNILRSIIRTFLKPFFYRCPVNLCGDLINILTGFCTFMFQKLSSIWQKFKQKYGTRVGYEDQMTENQEVFEDQLNRLLTREYISFLGALLQNKPMLDSNDSQIEDDSKTSLNNTSSKQLSELGVKIFQIETIRSVIVSTVFDGLHWLDTVTNIHCLSICELVLKQLLNDNLIQQIHEANYLLHNALCGLQELGEHDSNQGLLLSFAMHVYEGLRPRFPDLQEFLISSVGCDLQSVEKMEKLMFRDADIKPGMEKQKKDAFKHVVVKIIGKNIGQYHKRDIIIKNLPPLFIMAKEEKDCNIINNAEDNVCNLFFPSY